MNKFAFILIVILVTAGCENLTDTVTSRYANLAEARADHLFERGWLPDILPESATRIRTSNNLDINTSVGEFHFIPLDGPALFGKLIAGAPTNSPFAEWSDTVNEYSKSGFTGWQYHDADTTWAFFCVPAKGKCEYFAWLNK